MKVCANERNASLLASYKASAAKVRRRQRLSERGLGVLSATNRESSTAPEKHTIGLSDKARSTEECCLQATCEQRTSRLNFPCAGAFASFARQKKRIERLTLQFANTVKGKNYRNFRSPYRLRFVISPFQGLRMFVFTFFVALADYAL